MPADLLAKSKATTATSPTETMTPARRPAPREPTTLNILLLACGVLAPLVYLASDVIAGMRWDGYSFRDQTISELNAIGAPTRSLTIALGLVGYTLLAAFGVGVWRSAGGQRRLRVVGSALVGLGVLSLWAVPFASMHVREAEETLTDTLHLLGGAIVAPLLLVSFALGASVFGKRYRLYSIATVLVIFAFVTWSAMDGSAMADNLATPWLGVKERIWVYAYQLWLVVFAIALLRQQRQGSAEGTGRDGVSTKVRCRGDRWWRYVSARMRPEL